MKLSKDLIGASAVPLILTILEGSESYGYAIIERVRFLSDGEIEWTDGMLYPVLHRLEEQGVIQSQWGHSETKRKRKYYSLTPSGKSVLADQKAQWRVITNTFNHLWGVGYA